MIDISKESVLPLAELLKRVARDRGIRRSWKTWYRWCDKNCQNGGSLNRLTGERVYLEFIYFGGVMHSSVEAFERFWKKQNEGSE